MLFSSGWGPHGNSGLVSVTSWNHIDPRHSTSFNAALREPAMLFMIIERFKDQDMLPVYKKLQHNGRMMPHGLKYVDSWVEPNFARCFQLMECDDLRLLQQWILNWRGSGTLFEIVPVVPNKDTRELFMSLLDPAKPET
jgi:hypothetical protein